MGKEFTQDNAYKFYDLQLTLYKTSPRHRFACIYSKKISLGKKGSKTYPLIIKVKSAPAFDLFFLLCAAHFQEEKEERIKRYGWVSSRYLCEVYFNDTDEIKTEIIHGYIGTKLRGSLKRALRWFNVGVNDFFEREDNHYRVSVPKECITIDRSVYEFGLCEARDNNFGEQREGKFRDIWAALNK